MRNPLIAVGLLVAGLTMACGTDGSGKGATSDGAANTGADAPFAPDLAGDLGRNNGDAGTGTGGAAGTGGTAAAGTGGTGGGDARVASGGAGDGPVAAGGTGFSDARAGTGGAGGSDGLVATGGTGVPDGPIATGGVRDAQVATGGRLDAGGVGTGGTPGAIDADDSFYAGSLNFAATPAVIAPGQSSTLSWPSRTATSLSIDQGIGSVLGKTSVVVTPTQTTTYILTLNNSLRDKVTVTVTQAGFTRTGDMTGARSKHTATLLSSGKVLIAGGYKDGSGMASAELYDPDTGTFTATGSMTLVRFGHTATLLSNGKVLMVGAADSVSAELYDPATGTFTATGKLTSTRTEHTATLLSGGMVLVAGGGGASSPLASAELYDPATGTFAATGNLTVPRTRHAAVLLSNGTVLLVGGHERVTAIGQGFGLTSAELYDPKAGLFAATGSMAAKRAIPTTAPLPGGKVLVAGGQIGGEGAIASRSLEIYDPAARTFVATGDLIQARDYCTTTVLPSGNVLIAGGYQGGGSYGNFFASAELYDPETGKCTATGGMAAKREFHTATLLTNGKVLVAGGDSGSALVSAELYQ